MALNVKSATYLEDPPIARFLFSDTRMAWLWLPLRLWLGWAWFDAAEHKITDPKWVQTGEALQGFWKNALSVSASGKPVIAVDWYRNFIQFLLDSGSFTWFAKVVAYGELMIGLLLIVGAFTGIAAVAGATMNWNFVMAGTASTNALLFLVAIVIIMAWKNAGWVGADRWLLPMLGTPWHPGKLIHHDETPKVGGPQGAGARG